MKDLKNLSGPKRFSGFTFMGSRNRRMRPSPAFNLSLPVGQRLRRLKWGLVILAVVLALVPLAVPALKSVVPLWNRYAARNPVRAEAAQTPKSPADALPASQADLFETAGILLEQAEVGSDGLTTARSTDGLRFNYTTQYGLQKRVHDYFEQYKVPYGVFVAMEPSSGRILGMTSYSAVNPQWARESYYGLYPMASLFKIVTATAALESRKITPQTVVEFRGKSTSENPRFWSAARRGKNNRLDVTYAMGKSINPVYGRLACDIAGRASVMECVDRFGFNQQLLPGTPARPSQAAGPASDHGLMLMGAGLDHEVKISPLHAAVVMSAIANDGKMMAPALTSSIIDERGIYRDRFTPKTVRQLVTPDTAVSLKQMLSSTVVTGTSRKAFHDRRGRPLINVPIAAKTGSINGTDPKGHYSWFAAFAPINNPRIALVALVINQDKWKIKASQVGQQALEEFFRQ
ncbi:MAG TPA: penicillin-binding protein [Desulfuromonadales bacterium]|nr:penicillin-binding protein [Desulfuromonadales bacterium]